MALKSFLHNLSLDSVLGLLKVYKRPLIIGGSIVLVLVIGGVFYQERVKKLRETLTTHLYTYVNHKESHETQALSSLRAVMDSSEDFYRHLAFLQVLEEEEASHVLEEEKLEENLQAITMLSRGFLLFSQEKYEDCIVLLEAFSHPVYGPLGDVIRALAYWQDGQVGRASEILEALESRVEVDQSVKSLVKQFLPILRESSS